MLRLEVNLKMLNKSYTTMMMNNQSRKAVKQVTDSADIIMQWSQTSSILTVVLLIILSLHLDMLKTLRLSGNTTHTFSSWFA